MNVVKVANAKYYETFRNLPRFSHKELACINPSPKKIKEKVEMKKP